MSPSHVTINLIVGIVATIIGTWIVVRWANGGKEIWRLIWMRAGMPLRGVLLFVGGAVTVQLLLEYADPAPPFLALPLLLLMLGAILATLLGAVVLFIIAGRRLVDLIKRLLEGAWKW